jgi:hypothetical protein
LLAYIFLFERHAPDTAQLAEQTRRLLPDLDPAQVTRAEIIRSNSVTCAERSLDHWMLTEPTYPAESVVIENWLTALSALPRRASIPAREVLAQPGGLALYGLDPPQATVALQQGTRRLQFRLGARTAVGDRIYLQLSGADDVLVTDAAPLERLPQAAGDWRDLAFLDLAGLGFDRLNVRAGGREFEVQREGASRLWRMAKPRAARADNSRLELLFRELHAARVARFVKDFPGADLEPYGLLPPDVALTFGRGTNVLLVAEFGKNPTNDPQLTFARRSLYPNTVVLVPRSVPDTLSLPYTNFLDFQLIDQPLAAVDKLEVIAPDPFVLQRQTNGAWLVQGATRFPADPALVQQFLNQLRALRIEEIVKEVVTELDLPNYGLASPARQYLLNVTAPGGTNQLLLRVDFGSSRDGRVFVRRSDENSVYAVRLDDTLGLPQAPYQLHDRRIWSFTTNQVTAITIAAGGETRRMLRNGTGQWSIASGSQGMVNTFALEELAYRLGQLWSKAWIAQGDRDLDRYGIPQVNQQLTVEVNGAGGPQALAVSFGATSLSGGPFALTRLETGNVVFEFPFEIFRVFQEVLDSMAVKPGGAR